jgi:hypothetical protein
MEAEADRAEHYRAKAHEARTLAASEWNLAAKSVLLELSAEYLRMAELEWQGFKL